MAVHDALSHMPFPASQVQPVPGAVHAVSFLKTETQSLWQDLGPLPMYSLHTGHGVDGAVGAVGSTKHSGCWERNAAQPEQAAALR